MKESFKRAFGVASSYFGIIVGPAMVSGTFAISYYAKYGLNAFWLPILTSLLAGLVIYKGVEFARVNNCYDYDSFSHKLFGKYFKYINPLFTVLMLVIGFVSISVHYALGASLASSVFGLNYFLGCLLIGALILAITIFGSKVVRGSNKILFFIMTAITIIFTAYSVSNNSFNISFEKQPLLKGIGMALAYGFANSAGTIMPIVSISENIQSKKESLLAAILSTVFNYVIILLTVLIVLPYCPGVFDLDAPVLSILNSFNTPALGTIYTILLLFAILSSAPALLSAQTRRWSKSISNNINEKVRYLVVALVFSIGACLIARFGVQSIVNNIYTIFGVIAIPILYLPIVFTKSREEKN